MAEPSPMKERSKVKAPGGKLNARPRWKWVNPANDDPRHGTQHARQQHFDIQPILVICDRAAPRPA